MNLVNFTWEVNTGSDYLTALFVFVGLIIVLKIFQVIVLARLRKLAKKTKTDFDDVLIEIFKKIKSSLLFLSGFIFQFKIYRDSGLA